MRERMQEIGLGIVQNQSGEVLIIQRANEVKGSDEVELTWAFPGGKIEKDETQKAGTQREVLEETGYYTQAVSVIAERQHPQFPVHVYYLECTLENDSPQNNRREEEVKQMKWVSPNKLSGYFTTDLDKRVAEYLGI